MKKIAVLLILIGFILVSSSVYAERYEIGANVAVKVDYFRFMDSTMNDAGAEDGMFVGIEAYKQLFVPNLYFGVETGWAGTRGGFNEIDGFEIFRIDTEVDYVPIEFNAKYIVEINPCLFFDLGAGLSYNYIDIKGESFGFSASQSDWLFGGQFFAELNYKFTPNFFVGIGVKYQLTENIELFGINTNTSADNLRAGVQLGYKF